MRRLAVALTALALMLAACSSSATRARGSGDVLRLGVFPNLTHAPALVGIADGIFTRDLAPTTVDVTSFVSGSQAGQAIEAGSIDAAYIGPVPAASLLEKGSDVRIVSGTVQGGASLVVRTGSGIASPSDLQGRTVAVPSLGNTQDIALRTWLHHRGMKARDEGGDVNIVPIDNAVILQAFQQKQVDAAWEPEPYPSLLQSKGLATEFVNERTLWPNGRFPTTELLVTGAYADAHPDVVKRLVQANFDAVQFVRTNEDRAKELATRELGMLGAPALSPSALDRAWSQLTFSFDPLPAAMETDAVNAWRLGDFDTKPDNLSRIFALRDLNALLSSKGMPTVSARGAP
jgi:NitT/TauT family transport system substrate-binding protein